MENNQIELVQHPVISHALIEVGKSVTSRLADLNIENTVATIDTVKGLKDLRAELNKELADFETQRKFIKEGVLYPYNEFEAVYKAEVSDKYKSAIETLKDKIAIVEDKIKEDKKEAVKSYFVELCLSEEIDFVDFTKVGLDINLSTTEKAYKEKCNEFITRIADDLKLIDTQNYKAEILVEYKKTLNASKAIKEIQDRKQAEKEELEREKLKEVQRRTIVLRGLTMIYRDFTKTFEYVSDENIYIENGFVESATKEEFASKVILIEQLIANKKANDKANEVKTPEPSLSFGRLMTEMAKPITSQPAPEPLRAPVIEQPKEDLKTAAFEVSGTMAQLRALGQYMKDNLITYRNI